VEDALRWAAAVSSGWISCRFLSISIRTKTTWLAFFEVAIVVFSIKQANRAFCPKSLPSKRPKSSRPRPAWEAAPAVSSYLARRHRGARVRQPSRCHEERSGTPRRQHKEVEMVRLCFVGFLVVGLVVGSDEVKGSEGGGTRGMGGGWVV